MLDKLEQAILGEVNYHRMSAFSMMNQPEHIAFGPRGKHKAYIHNEQLIVDTPMRAENYKQDVKKLAKHIKQGRYNI